MLRIQMTPNIQSRSHIQLTSMLKFHPPRQPIRHITGITMRRPALPQIPTLIYTPRIIDPCRAIKRTLIIPLRRIDTLRQPIAPIRAPHAIRHHLHDHVRRARVANAIRVDAVVAARGAVVVLHHARVGDAVVGGRGADAAAGFLHYDCEDKAVVDEGVVGDFLDGGVDVRGFVFRVWLLVVGFTGSGEHVFAVVESCCIGLSVWWKD